MANRPRPVQWFRQHPHMADALLALVVAVLAIASITNQDLPEATIRATDGWAIALVTLTGLCVAWRRRWPLAVLLGSLALIFIRQTVLRYPDGSDTLAPLIAAYTVGVLTEARQRFIAIVGGVLGVMTIFTFVEAGVRSKPELLGNALANVIIFGTAFLLGDNIRRRRQRLADLQERNNVLEREQVLLAANAVSAERTRIARELHDVVAHSVSVIAIQAGGARRIVHTRPELASEALSTIETTARQTLDELRRLLGVLRTADDAGKQQPQPGVNDVIGLIGLVDADPDRPVRLHVEGLPRPLPAMVDLSAYRIVQEALTNVRKHAGPTSALVDISVRYLPDALEVEVTDDGRGAAANRSEANGYGLTGMRERASLCGGHLDAGPRRGGGWFVRARLPIEAAT